MYVILWLVDPPQVDIVNRQQTPNPDKNINSGNLRLLFSDKDTKSSTVSGF